MIFCERKLSFRFPKFVSSLKSSNCKQFVTELRRHTFRNLPPTDRYWYHENSKPTTFERDSIKISLHEHDNLISFSILMLSAFLAPWHENCWLQNITRDETVWENSWTRHQSLKMHHRIFTTPKNALPRLHGENKRFYSHANHNSLESLDKMINKRFMGTIKFTFASASRCFVYLWIWKCFFLRLERIINTISEAAVHIVNILDINWRSGDHFGIGSPTFFQTT